MRTSSVPLLALVAGCHWDLNSKSTDPRVGPALFPRRHRHRSDGQFVYVSNGNADLRYGGGTVMMVDMLSFECTVAQYRHDNPLSDTDAMTPLPAPCTAAPGATQLDWAARAVTAMCRRNALDSSIIDCDESSFIFQNSTVAIGNFAGTIRVLNDADPAALHRSLFVGGARRSVGHQIEVHFPNGKLMANPGSPDVTALLPTDMNSPGVLQCVGDPRTLLTRPQYDPVTQKTTAPATCDPSYLVQDYYCTSSRTAPSASTTTARRSCRPSRSACDDRVARRAALVVAHLATGQVSVIVHRRAGVAGAALRVDAVLPARRQRPPRLLRVAQQDPTDRHSLWYVTSSSNALISTFRIADANVVVVAPESTFALTNTFVQGIDVRDIIFDIGGNRAFVTENNPPSVLVLDTRTDTTTGDQPHNLVTDIVDVCHEDHRTWACAASSCRARPARRRTSRPSSWSSASSRTR